MDPRALLLSKERIAKKVQVDPDTGCWNWVGVLHSQGYGMIRSARKHHLAHRASYQVFVGDVPDDLLVCHHCDNRRCVNPEHLFLGTIDDNQKDMKRKDRSVHGEKASWAKLKEKQVKEILALRGNTSLSQRAIAKQYGVSPSLICMLWKGRVWERAQEAA